MPNWCYSELQFEGSEGEIKKLFETDLDFEKIAPMPNDFDTAELSKSEIKQREKQNKKKYGHADWYSWALKNWGVKWNPTRENQHKEVELESPTKITAQLTTAWGLPLAILKKISLVYSSVTVSIIDCEEEAGFFVGSLTIKNGEITEDNIYEPTKKEMIKRGMMDEEDVN